MALSNRAQVRICLAIAIATVGGMLGFLVWIGGQGNTPAAKAAYAKAITANEADFVNHLEYHVDVRTGVCFAVWQDHFGDNNATNVPCIPEVVKLVKNVK